MNYNLSLAEAYHNLDIVIELLHSQNAETDLIESINIAKNVLLATEMMGIVTNSLQKE